jgi:hypothetical protein
VFLLQVQVEAVVTVSTKYDVAYKYLKAKREKSDDGKIYKEIFVAWMMLDLNQQYDHHHPLLIQMIGSEVVGAKREI